MYVHKSILTLCFIFISWVSWSQDKTVWKIKDNVTVDGYMKYLPSVSFSGADSVLTNNLFHNRININAFFGEKFTAKIAIRNRMYWGETVKIFPNYGQMIGADNGYINLSHLSVNSDAVIIHSIIDRAYLDYASNNWQIRLGRQRINWGINLAWNANDLFNTYNIVDFDYEERAGTDAIRVQYYFENSNIDMAYKVGKDWDNSVIAGMYKFNKWAYDFQILGANYNTDIAIGAGWAGSIKNIGFKGEGTFFKDKHTSTSVTSISSSFDYFFQKGTYLNISTLYTSNGDTSYNPLALDFTANSLTAKTLMPSKFSSLFQLSNNLSPRVQASLISIFGYGMNILFIMPSVDYSIANNWDLNLTGQLFYASQNDDFKNLSNSVFLRLRFSY